MMFKKVIIKNDERGLLFKKGSYIKHLQPGVYRHSSFSDDTVILQNVAKRFAVPNKELNLFLQDEQLVEELTIADVQDYEYVLHFEDGKFSFAADGRAVCLLECDEKTYVYSR